MRFLILLLLLFSVSAKVYGQNLYQTRAAEFQPHVSGHITTFSVPENLPLLDKNYLNESWVAGIIHLFHGQVIKGYLFKFDISQNKLEIQDKNSIKILEGALVEYFTIYDVDSGIEKYYLNGFIFNPALGRSNGFYEVVESGDQLSLIAGYKIDVIKANYDPKFDIGDKQDKIIQKRNLFFLKDEQLMPVKNKLKKNKEVFLHLYDSIEDYISNENLDYSSEADLKKLVRHYNKFK